MDLFLLLIIGLVVGFIGGFAGIGGAPFLVAYLVIVLNYPQLSAQGNVLTVMLGPMSLMGVISLWPSIKPQLLNIGLGVLTYMLFSYFGAAFAFYIGEEGMKFYFAVLLLIIAGIQLYPFLFNSEPPGKVKHISIIWIFFLGSLIGFIGGFFGIGAGVLFVPLLITFFKLDKDMARGLSLAILLPPVSLGGFYRYNMEGIIEWNLVWTIFITYFISNYFGAKLGSKVKTDTFQFIYSFILIGIAFIYLYL